MAHIIVNTNISRGMVNKNIYGQFSEHLGRCIYEGIFSWNSFIGSCCFHCVYFFLNL